MKLTFWGASQQVTGSMYVLELEDDYRILIDCGFDYESRERKDDKDKKKKEPEQGLFPINFV